MSEGNIHTTRHAGRVAVVTGAASGIGRATALRLAAEGARVVGCDISAEALQETVAAAPAGTVVAEAGDISRQEDVDRAAAHALEAFGRIDIVANVAGILDNMLAPHEIDDETWSRVLRINLDGPMRLIRAVLPHFREQGRGAIVNVASEASLRGGTAGVAYTTSKHAVLGLTRSVAWMYGPEGIRCNAVCPGGVATNIASTLTAPSTFTFDRIGAVIGLSPTLAEPDDIAGLISWLACDEARNVNGAAVTDDGGWSAG